jgi:hypothetical protein
MTKRLGGSQVVNHLVCARRVILLVYSLSLHRRSYIGFILAFASSIHNKQTFYTYECTQVSFFLLSQMEVSAGPAQRRNDAAGPAQRRNDLLDEKGPSRRWGVVIAVATAAFTGCALWLRADGSLLRSTRGLRQEDAVMRTGELWAKLGAGAQALILRKQRESCCQEGMIAQVCMNTYIFLIGIPYHSQRCPIHIFN